MLKRFLFIILVFGMLTIGALAQTAASEGEKLALLAKPAVVRIIDGYIGEARWEGKKVKKTHTLVYGGSGSGAFISADGYIVTNAHVVDITKEGEQAAIKYLFRQFAAYVAKDYGLTLNQLTDADWNSIDAAFRQTFKFRHIHDVVIPNGTAYPFEIKSFGDAKGEGKDVAVIKIEIKNAPVLALGDSDKVKVQDHITVLGYPAAAQSDSLDNKSRLQSSITDGKVSARKNMADGSPVLEVSAPATHGNSGGPVLNDKGEIIGLLTFRGNLVNGQEVQGFTFAVTSATVKEFVKQAGASNEGSVADKSYREGLELYHNQRFTAALEKFEKVQKLFPQHSEISALIQECEDKKGTETNYWFWGILAVGTGLVIMLVVGTVMIIGGLFLINRVRKGKVRQAPSPVMAASAVNSQREAGSIQFPNMNSFSPNRA